MTWSRTADVHRNRADARWMRVASVPDTVTLVSQSKLSFRRKSASGDRREPLSALHAASYAHFVHPII